MANPWAEANAELMRELFAALSYADRGAIESRLADDVVWRTPGNSRLAGEAVGPQGVIDQLAMATELTNGTFAIEVQDVLSSEERAAVVYRGTGEREGSSLDLLHVALFVIVDGEITEVDVAPLDLYAYDEFWA